MLYNNIDKVRYLYNNLNESQIMFGHAFTAPSCGAPFLWLNIAWSCPVECTCSITAAYYVLTSVRY